MHTIEDNVPIPTHIGGGGVKSEVRQDMHTLQVGQSFELEIAELKTARNAVFAEKRDFDQYYRIRLQQNGRYRVWRIK